MARRFEPKSSRTPVALAVMVGFHAGVAWLALNGLGREAVDIVRRPLMAALIEEVRAPEPPPPPPPPKPARPVEAPRAQAPPPPFVPPPEVTSPAPEPAAVAMESVAVPPAEPVVVAPPPARGPAA